MLAFARKQPLQPRDTDLNALAEDSIGLLRPALGAEIEIETVLAPDAWHCLIDPSQHLFLLGLCRLQEPFGALPFSAGHF